MYGDEMTKLERGGGGYTFIFKELKASIWQITGGLCDMPQQGRCDGMGRLRL